MAREMFYTAIDLGTTKVCTIIARVGQEGDLRILGTGIVPSQGVIKGRVECIAETREAVKASLDEAQRYMSRRISSAYLGITGDHISCINTKRDLNGERGERAISSRDLQQLVESSYPLLYDGKEVLHVIPISYEVDGLMGVRNPVGLYADKVQVDSHVVLGEVPALKNLMKAVEGCKVSVRSMVLQSLAAAEAVLTEGEREMGVVLVDMGGGTTDVAIFRTGSPWYTSVIPVGSNQLTRDLAVAMGISFYAAEELKIRWGHALPSGLERDEEVDVPGFQGEPHRTESRRTICQPFYDRLTETLKLVLLRVRQAGLRQMPPGGVVLTGGATEMPGLKELALKVMGGPARIASPRGVVALPSQLQKPAFSASVGTLFWGIKHQGERRHYKNGGRTFLGSKTFDRLFRRKAEPSPV